MKPAYFLYGLILLQLSLLARVPWLYSIVAVWLTLLVVAWGRHHFTASVRLCLLLVALVPPLVCWRQRSLPFPELGTDDFVGLKESLRLESVLPSEQFAAVIALLRQPDPGLTNNDNLALQRALQPASYQSVTLYNLDGEPLLWAGRHFAETRTPSEPATAQLAVYDGRLFLRQCTPVPNPTQVEGYVLIETLVLSSHQNEMADTWLTRSNPRFGDYQVTVAESRPGTFITYLADELAVARLPYDIRFLQIEQVAGIDELMIGLWLLLLFRLLLVARRMAADHAAWVTPLLGLVLLASADGAGLPNVTLFGSYLFASTLLKGLLITPGHFLVTGFLLFLLLYHGQERAQRSKIVWNVGFFLALAWFTFAGAHWLQTLTSFSLVHPLEAFNTPGSMAAYLAFLAVPAYLVYLLRQSRVVEPGVKAAFTLALVLVVLFHDPTAWPALGSLLLLWWLVHRPVNQVVAASLLVLLFYPTMAAREHRDEIDFVRYQLLDEITLLVERNHFRMGRLIRQLPTLKNQIDIGAHPHLMEMFAKRNGLLEEHIDFALQLRDDRGAVVSVIDQHISLDRIPDFQIPLDQIETLSIDDRGDRGGAAPEWLVFRTILETDQRDYEFLAILGNNFHNLSLIRELGRLQNQRYPLRGGDAFPYFAYILDVYNQEGLSLYDQGNPAALTVAERQKLEQEFIFWKADPEEPRNTLFFFSGPPYIYRITHKATPVRMIAVRCLALMLASWVMLRLLQLALKPSRTPLRAWQRSFALKMAAFMFLTSLLPTATLGYLLIKSIRKNQVREVESMARANIGVVKRLFQQYLNPEEDLLPSAEGEDGEPRPRRFEQGPHWGTPVARFSRILNEDLSLYRNGRLHNTQQPEIYRMGLLSRRLPYKLARDLVVEGKPYSFMRRDLQDGSSILVTYSALSLPDGGNAVVSMTMIPFNRRQGLRWQEQLEFSVTILIGLFFAMAGFTRLVARNFLRPVSAITRAAVRVAKGLQNRPLVVHRQDELQQMVSAFNTMQERIQESRRRLSDQLKILDETLVAMSGGLLGFDRNGRVLLQNKKARELLGLNEAARTVDDLIAAQQHIAPLQDMLVEGRSGELSLRLVQPGGEQELLIKVRVVHTASQKGLFLIVAIEDVTDALAAGRFKAWSEMARRVAHEIKNPLTPIQLEIDYLVKLYQDRHPAFEEALTETRTEISRQVEILRQTATEFGDYARPIEPDLEPTNLADLLDELVLPYGRSADGLELVRDWPESVPILADIRLLRRALQNLLVNAVQAMDGEGRLQIDVVDEGERWLCRVTDTGPGIPVEDHHRVFEAYFSTKDQGTGLGLIIAKRTIQIHGGTIHIDAAYHDGTCFMIRLPKLTASPE